MTDDIRIRDERIAAWLGEGPHRPADDLAARVLAAARREDQRSAIVARALGAPTGGRVVVSARGAWLLLAAGLLAAALLLVALLAGGPRPNRLPALVVVTATPTASGSRSPSPRQTPSPEPSPRATPGPTSEPTPTPTLIPVYENHAAGFSLEVGGTYTSDGLMAPSPDDSGQVFMVSQGRCQADLCFPAARIAYGTPADGAVVTRSYNNDGSINVEIRIRGADLGELEASWIETYGASSFQTTSVAGRDAVIAERPGGSTAFFVDNGRVWAVSTAPGLFGESDAKALRRVLDGFRLLPEVQPTADVERTVHVGTPGVDLVARVPAAWIQHAGRDGSVSYDTRLHDDGSVRQALEISVTSDDLPEAARSIASFADGYRRSITLTLGEDEGRLLLGSESGSTVPPVAIVRHGTSTLVLRTLDIDTPSLGEAALRRLLSSLRIVDP